MTLLCQGIQPMESLVDFTIGESSLVEIFLQ